MCLGPRWRCRGRVRSGGGRAGPAGDVEVSPGFGLSASATTDAGGTAMGDSGTAWWFSADRKWTNLEPVVAPTTRWSAPQRVPGGRPVAITTRTGDPVPPPTGSLRLRVHRSTAPSAVGTGTDRWTRGRRNGLGQGSKADDSDGGSAAATPKSREPAGRSHQRCCHPPRAPSRIPAIPAGPGNRGPEPAGIPDRPSSSRLAPPTSPRAVATSHRERWPRPSSRQLNATW